MIIDGRECIETPEGYVFTDVVDNTRPHNGQMILAGICVLYAWLVGTVIYQIKFPQPGDTIGVFSYNLLLATQRAFGEAVLVVVPLALITAVYIVLVRVDVVSRITKALAISSLIIWICAAFALLYGFENNQHDNLIGRYSVGVAINLLGRPATLGMYWALLLWIVAKFAERQTGWCIWTYINDFKKKAVVQLEQLHSQLMRCLPQPTAMIAENIVPNIPAIPTVASQISDDSETSVEFNYRVAEFRKRFEKPAPVNNTAKPVSKNHQALEQDDLGELILVIDWLKVGGLALLSAEAGVGKTRLLVALACAIASGQNFLGWNVYGARKVLYVDGEMGKRDMRDRVRSLGTAPNNLIMLTYDMCREDQFPNICTTLGQSLIERELLANNMRAGSVIILDSLLTLSQEEIDYPKAHAAYQSWLLRLRERGYTVLAAHHTNKQGVQNGSNKKNTLLNVSILMVRPKSYVQNGLETRAEIEFKKCRESNGVDISPSVVSCKDGVWTRECANGDVYEWRMQQSEPSYAGEYSVNKVNIHPHTSDSVNIQVNNPNSLNIHEYSRDYSPEYSPEGMNIHVMQAEKDLNNAVIDLSKEGKTQSEIAVELKISQSKVSRILAKAS